MKTKFLAISAALALALAAVAPATAAERTITVSGEGEATAAPDMATVRVGVAVRADTARGAVDGMSQAMQKVLDAVAAAAIPAKDVQTEGLNLGSVYRPEPQDGSAPPPPQFEARSSVAVRTGDLKGLGALLDGLVSAGANELQGVSFGLSDPAAARDEARRAAVADALARAKLYAEAAGVTLGQVVSLSENGPAPEPMMRMSAAPAAADKSVPIAGGEMSVAAQVTLVLSIGD